MALPVLTGGAFESLLSLLVNCVHFVPIAPPGPVQYLDRCPEVLSGLPTRAVRHNTPRWTARAARLESSDLASRVPARP